MNFVQKASQMLLKYENTLYLILTFITTLNNSIEVTVPFFLSIDHLVV